MSSAFANRFKDRIEHFDRRGLNPIMANFENASKNLPPQVVFDSKIYGEPSNSLSRSAQTNILNYGRGEVYPVAPNRNFIQTNAGSNFVNPSPVYYTSFQGFEHQTPHLWPSSNNQLYQLPINRRPTLHNTDYKQTGSVPLSAKLPSVKLPSTYGTIHGKRSDSSNIGSSIKDKASIIRTENFSLGGLGPNLNEVWNKKRVYTNKQKIYSEMVKELNVVKGNSGKSSIGVEEKIKEISRRQRALEFSKSIPKPVIKKISVKRCTR